MVHARRAFTLAASAVLSSALLGLALGPASAAAATPSCNIKLPVLEGVLHVRLVKERTRTEKRRVRSNGVILPTTEYFCSYSPVKKGHGARIGMSVSLENPFPRANYVNEEASSRFNAGSAGRGAAFATIGALPGDNAYYYKAPGGGGEAARPPEFYTDAYVQETRIAVNLSGPGVTAAKATALLIAVVKHVKL